MNTTVETLHRLADKMEKYAGNIDAIMQLAPLVREAAYLLQMRLDLQDEKLRAAGVDRPEVKP